MFRLFLYINGVTEIFETNKNETIRDLKSKIEDSFGIDPDFQRLESESSILDDDKTLNDYEICEESVIYFYFYRRSDILRLLVRILDGTKVKIKTNTNEKIRGLKLKLQDKSNINMDDKELVFQGVILKDDKTVIEYNIFNNSIILLISRPKLIQIWIQPINDDKFQIKINTNEIIRDLKMKIQEKSKFDPNINKPKLIFRGSVLDDDKTVEQCGICDEAVIKLIILRLSFPISVRSNGGKSITMETHPTEIIRDLKMKIHKGFEFVPKDCQLIFQSYLSENNKTVSECGIVENSVINVNIGPDMDISVRYGNQNYRIRINRYETVLDLKMKFSDQTGHYYSDVHLHLLDQYLLDDDMELEQCGIRDGDIVFAKFYMTGGGGDSGETVNVYCKPTGGESFVLFRRTKNYDPNYAKKTNRDLKKKIQAKMGIHPDDQILSHKGTLLHDDDKSSASTIDLDIGANASEYLVVQLVHGKLFLGIHLRNGTIRDLKKEIQEELGIHPDNQILSAAGANLRDEQILNDYPMNEIWIVALFIRRNEPSQVKQSQLRQSKRCQPKARKSLKIKH